jgi:hypothetical protein
MTYRLLTQITIVILTVCIFVFYVQPRFGELKLVEVEIEKYKPAAITKTAITSCNCKFISLLKAALRPEKAKPKALDLFLR